MNRRDMKSHGKRALVTLSGGQDSTTCLYWAKSHYDDVRAISFRYNQRHAIELESKRRHRAHMASSTTSSTSARCSPAPSPLTNSDIAVETYASAAVLPGGLEKTFVPGRNIPFTIAANRAYVADCDAVVVGLSQEDYGGYPDCRAEFVEQMERALALGLDREIEIVAPVLHLDKRQTVLMAQGSTGAWRRSPGRTPATTASSALRRLPRLPAPQPRLRAGRGARSPRRAGPSGRRGDRRRAPGAEK
ncbi:MAG: 7-cyano-7-deazaguanine synthase [bacterium]